MKAKVTKHLLQFKRPAGTSRGTLTSKETYILKIEENGKTGIGECGLFRGLSSDDVPEYEDKLQWLCAHINLHRNEIQQELQTFPSIWFGYEQALLNLEHGGNLYFPSDFTNHKKDLAINGLIWMGSIDFMKEQIEQKMEEHFGCIKLKIGVNWSAEKEVVKELRSLFSGQIRVDANGAFSYTQAQEVLQELKEMGIHSIEQPIKAGHWEEMAKLCEGTPTPIALDEELIGIYKTEEKKKLLDSLKPQYIILKPTLVGGITGTDEWIALAEERKIGWWITSALESNIGLNALAQYTATKNNPLPQGLGTGMLYTNNFPSRLNLKGDQLSFKA